VFVCVCVFVCGGGGGAAAAESEVGVDKTGGWWLDVISLTWELKFVRYRVRYTHH